MKDCVTSLKVNAHTKQGNAAHFVTFRSNTAVNFDQLPGGKIHTLIYLFNLFVKFYTKFYRLPSRRHNSSKKRQYTLNLIYRISKRTLVGKNLTT